VADEVGDAGIRENGGEIGVRAVELALASHEPAELTVVDVVEVVREAQGLHDAHAGRNAGPAAAR
jgi:hypothetical protein